MMWGLQCTRFEVRTLVRREDVCTIYYIKGGCIVGMIYNNINHCKVIK